MDIVELIYRPSEPQGYAKDYEFGRATMRLRWAQGLSDAQTTLLVAMARTHAARGRCPHLRRAEGSPPDLAGQ
jgi:hypothetical protein